MTLVRNVVGIVADVTDAEADRMSSHGWSLVEGEKPATEKKSPAASTKRRSTTKKSD